MKKSLTLMMLLLFQNAIAEKLIFSNNNEQVDIVGNVEINNQSGDVTVTTVGEYEIVNVGDQPVILGFYPSDYDITEGSTITVNWTVVHADSCNASVTNGTASWLGSKESDDGSWSQSGVSVTNLPATLRLQCDNTGNTTFKEIQLTEQSGGVTTNPTFNNFRVNNQSPSVTVSGTATVSWSTTDISSCTASANPPISGWSGTKSSSGSEAVEFVQSGTISMNCDGIVRNVNVTFSNNSSCSSSIYPSGYTRVNEVYTSLNDGFNFGESTNASFLLTLGTDEFVAVPNFSYNEVNSTRRIVLKDPPTQRLLYLGSISISECPGDFTASAACVLTTESQETLRITTDPTAVSTNKLCKIDPGTTYYINYILTDDPANGTARCGNPSFDECTFFYSESL